MIIFVFSTLGTVTEFFSVFFCMAVFSKKPSENHYRLKFAASLILYAVISVFLNHNRYISESIGLLYPVLYIAKFASVLFILFRKNILLALYIFFLIDFMSSFIYSSFSVLLFKTVGFRSEVADNVLFLSVQILFFILAVLLRYKTDNNKIRSTVSIIPKHIFLLILLTISCFGGISTANTKSFEGDTSIRSFINILTVILSILVASIIISLIFNVISKQRFSNISSVFEKQVGIQLRHYEKLEEMDREMRRFRHDYQNHMQSVLSLIKMGEYREAEDYILNLQSAKQKTEPLFTTGNRLADAILTDKSEMLGENITIDYQGVIPASINNMDLCVVLSNSLDNAIEACRECGFPCVISVSASTMHGYFVITVKNPTVNKNTFYDIPLTTKEDKNSHGIGLLNIKDTAERNEGKLSVKCENQIFEMSVTFKTE